jgi:large subunit ribosomal protein L3
MAGQYGNKRITTQNLTVVKLIEDESLILLEGSVPGSKNGIVFISDACKYNLPEGAPFPAGLVENKDAIASDVTAESPSTDNNVKSENSGGDIEA